MNNLNINYKIVVPNDRIVLILKNVNSHINIFNFYFKYINIAIKYVNLLCNFNFLGNFTLVLMILWLILLL